MPFKKMNRDEIQRKYGQIKKVNFTKDQQSYGCKIMKWKCIQHKMNKVIRTLKNKFYKYMTSVSKKVYNDKL